jgi:hypothetical protein
LEVLTRYRPREPNQFEISDRTACALIGCSRHTARIALEDLEDRGWIVVVHVGRITGPRKARASVYALTWYPISAGEPALKSFLNWQPHPVQQLKSGPSTAHFSARKARSLEGHDAPQHIDSKYYLRFNPAVTIWC